MGPRTLRFRLRFFFVGWLVCFSLAALLGFVAWRMPFAFVNVFLLRVCVLLLGALRHSLVWRR